MEEDLASLIRKTAAQVRARDFLWSAAITAGIAIVLIVSGLVSNIWLPVIAWVVFLASLTVRYRFSSGREWALPVERVVENEISTKEAELATLRLARGVAQALPEPLFILERSGVIEHANPAAEEFLGSSVIEGRHFAAALRAPNVFEAAERVADGEASHVVDFTTIGAVERHCRAFVTPIGDASPPQRILVYIRDMTVERRVEQMRADFIASASHELRTPLASLLGFIETMRGHAKDDPEAQEKFLGIMQAQAERMQRLVADLMSLSRIELNEHVPPRANVDLASIAEDVIESLRPVFEQSEAIVDFENLHGAPVNIIGDRDELFQAIQNLLDNAAKYGGDPAMIKVKVGLGAAPSLAEDGEVAHRTGDSATQLAARQGVDIAGVGFVQVRDFGPGIERSDLPRLTERFYRVNIEHSKKSGGTGLGLAIVKHILNRHKAGLQVESRVAGGTAFTCYFKLSSRD
ncbi:MAG: PAS domain-containing protein [Parvularculaceae bacterium]|nr:PAS domain-containing protein [Parvularculaceae bacterium]